MKGDMIDRLRQWQKEESMRESGLPGAGGQQSHLTVSRQNVHEELLSLREQWQKHCAAELAAKQQAEEAKRQAEEAEQQAKRQTEEAKRQAKEAERRAEQERRAAEERKMREQREREECQRAYQGWAVSHMRQHQEVLMRFAQHYFGTTAAFQGLSSAQKKELARMCEAHCKKIRYSLSVLLMVLPYYCSYGEAGRFLASCKWFRRYGSDSDIHSIILGAGPIGSDFLECVE